jgi:hypothetical protein
MTDSKPAPQKKLQKDMAHAKTANPDLDDPEPKSKTWADVKESSNKFREGLGFSRDMQMTSDFTTQSKKNFAQITKKTLGQKKLQTEDGPIITEYPFSHNFLETNLTVNKMEILQVARVA